MEGELESHKIVFKQQEVKRKLLHTKQKCTNACSAPVSYNKLKDVQLKLSSSISLPTDLFWLWHKAQYYNLVCQLDGLFVCVPCPYSPVIFPSPSVHHYEKIAQIFFNLWLITNNKLDTKQEGIPQVPEAL